MEKFWSVFRFSVIFSFACGIILYTVSVHQSNWMSDYIVQPSKITRLKFFLYNSVKNDSYPLDSNQTGQGQGGGGKVSDHLPQATQPLQEIVSGSPNNIITTSHPPLKTAKLKSILMWNNYFQNAYNHLFREGGKVKNITCKNTCLLSRDRSHPEDHDALVFHLRNAQNPPMVRRPGQVYVAFLVESQIHQGGHYIKGGNFYNWSMSLLRESTVPINYHDVIKGKAAVSAENLPQIKTNRTGAKIAWVVSNCNQHYVRSKYVHQLKKYIEVDVYGGCGRPCPAPRHKHLACYERLAASGQYKFYLAFENSICKDYISEKPFLALQAGLVPVVMGGYSTADYQQGNFPPNSYINVRDFSSPEKLAQYLHHLDRDDTAYLAYHTWRKSYAITEIHQMCSLCDRLYHNLTPRTVDWGKFYDRDKQCDFKFGEKLPKS